MTKGFDKVFRLGAAKERVLEAARRVVDQPDGRSSDELVQSVDALKRLEAEFEQEDYFLRWDVADQEREKP